MPSQKALRGSIKDSVFKCKYMFLLSLNQFLAGWRRKRPEGVSRAARRALGGGGAGEALGLGAAEIRGEDKLVEVGQELV